MRHIVKIGLGALIVWCCCCHLVFAEKNVITLMTHDSFSVSEVVVEQFEKENDAKIRFLKSGDAGEALNKAILSKNNPMADLFYGVDNAFFSRALSEDLFIPYDSPQLKFVHDALKLDPKKQIVAGGFW